MLNDKNLVPFSNRSESEARENGRKGGKKSGETRRRKKALKSLMNDLLSSGIVNDDIYNMTVDMGFGADPTYGAAVVAAMVRQAALGDTKAFNAIGRPYRRGQLRGAREAPEEAGSIAGEEALRRGRADPGRRLPCGAGRLCCGGLER